MFKKKDKIRKIIIINSLIVFLLGFISHNLYTWAPSFLTMIFPVNESLFEHAKMIYITPIIYGLFWYLFLVWKDKKRDNYAFSLLITVITNILVFYALYLPIYYRFGESMIITLIIYLISIIISQVVNLLIIYNTKHSFLLNIIGIISLLILYVLFLYFTYNPLRIPFFFDPVHEVYGFYK